MNKTRIEILSIINRLSFFDSFSENEKEQVLAEDAHFQVYSPGERLIRKNSTDQNLFILLTGSVNITDETVLAVLNAGDILGEMAFLTDTRRTAHVIAREPVIALRLDRELFNRLGPEVREKFKDRIIEKLVARLDSANRELVRLGAGSRTGKASSGPFKVPGGSMPGGNGGSDAAFLSGRDLIRRIVASTSSLPTMPEVLVKVQQLIKLPNTTPSQLAKIIEADAAMVADILKVANSAYYGFRGKVSTIQHAASLFGTRRLAELIVSLGAGGVLGKGLPGYGIEAGSMWRHSIAAAVAASEIAAVIDSDLLENAYMTGLMHDVGKIILDPYVRERKLLFERYHKAHPDKTLHDAEQDIMGFDHAVIASILCESWNLPKAISFGIRHHHRPLSTDGHQLSHIVHLADCIVTRAGLGVTADTAPYPSDGQCASRLRLPDDTLQAAAEKARQYVDSLSGHFFNA